VASRWAVAAAVLVALAACDGDDGAAATRPAESAPPLVAVTTAKLPVLADFAVAPAAPETELSTVSATTLDAGEGSAVLLALGPPSVPGRCIVDARLRLHVEESSGPVPTELAVYPSHVFDALRKEDGEPFGYSGSLLDVRPRGVYAGAGGEWTIWDVTEVVRRWVSGRPFPSQGKAVPERGPVVLALRDVDGAEPFARVTIASSEDSGNAPHVELTSRDDCVRGRA
jgi:hypothetical protein